MKKPTFTCAIAGPIPGAVAAACLTELNVSQMTYDRFWPDLPAAYRPEVELAKIPLRDHDERRTPLPAAGVDVQSRSLFASASGTSGTSTPIALLQNQGLADLSYHHYYPQTSVAEPDLRNIPPRD